MVMGMYTRLKSRLLSFGEAKAEVTNEQKLTPSLQGPSVPGRWGNVHMELTLEPNMVH